MSWSYANIDWPATEAVGTWAGAAAASLAVFIAARLGQRNAAEAQRLQDAGRAKSLRDLYLECGRLVARTRRSLEVVSDREVPPAVALLEDMANLLNQVSPMDLPEGCYAADLVSNRQAVVRAGKALRSRNRGIVVSEEDRRLIALDVEILEVIIDKISERYPDSHWRPTSLPDHERFNEMSVAVIKSDQHIKWARKTRGGQRPGRSAAED